MLSSICVRDSVLDDLTEIFRIRSHKLVRPYQYRIYGGQLEYWKYWIQHSERLGDERLRLSTILVDNEIVGYVAQLMKFEEQYSFADCGWTLAPDHWGKGIMTSALREVLQRLFVNDGMQFVIADCFRTNIRCKRLLCKLKFTLGKIPLVERVTSAYQRLSVQWVERYRLDRDVWSSLAGAH